MLTECRLTRQSLMNLIREVRRRSAAFVVKEMMAILSAVRAMVRSIIVARDLPQLSLSSCYAHRLITASVVGDQEVNLRITTRTTGSVPAINASSKILPVAKQYF